MADEEIGSTDRPIRNIIDGIAGTVGGWWTGRAASQAADNYSSDDDNYYRERYENSPRILADRRFEDVRPAYLLGHLARINPEYRDREFTSIEPELRAGWTAHISSRHGDWAQVRDYAREAYTRDLSVSAREAAIRDRELDDNFRGDRVVNAERTASNRIPGAIDDRNDRGEDGNAEARLQLPVSRR